MTSDEKIGVTLLVSVSVGAGVTLLSSGLGGNQSSGLGILCCVGSGLFIGFILHFFW